MADVVQGEFTGDYDQAKSAFIYRYTCPQCGRRFKSTAPEASVPTNCHLCQVGRERVKGKVGLS